MEENLALRLLKHALAVAFLLTAVLSAKPDKPPFHIADLYRMKTPSSPVVSPDGKQVLFVLGSSDLEQGKSFSDLWLLDLSKRSVKRLTFSEAAERSPLWSEDGRWIYFVSGRKDGDQLWRMAADGGEAEQVSAFFPGISAPKLLPGGRKVVFTAKVFPECMADGAANERMAKRLREGPRQGHFARELLFRHWTAYRDWRYAHLFTLDLETGKVEALTEGKRDFPCYGGRYDVSPDGKALCTAANFDTTPALSTNSDLYAIDLSSRRGRNLTEENPAFDGNPAYSPDGRYIAFRRQEVPGYESDRFRLALYDRVSGRVRVLADTLDNWVLALRWSPDSRYVYFTAAEGGRVPVYRVAVEGGDAEKVLEHATVHDFTLTPDGTSIVYVHSAVGEPHELFRYTLGGEAPPERLTFFNRPVEEAVDIRPAERLWIEGAEGRRFECFLVKPHGFDPSKKYPCILNIHGGPQYQWADSFRGDWQVYPGAGYVLAFPNPHGSTGYGQAYTASISRDYDGKVMEDVDRAAAYLAGLHYVDAERMGAMGWSWGGYAVQWLEGNSKRFKALASMMGIFDLASMYNSTEELWFPEWDNGGPPWENADYYRRVSPSTYITSFKTPCLVITGERDYRVPYTQSIQFFTALRRRGVPAELIIFSNDGHWPDPVKSMPVYYNAHLAWFHRYLGGDPAPWDTEKLLRNLQFDSGKEE